MSQHDAVTQQCLAPYLPWNTIDVQFDHVLSTRIMFWFAFFILWINNAGLKEKKRATRLQYILNTWCQRCQAHFNLGKNNIIQYLVLIHAWEEKSAFLNLIKIISLLLFHSADPEGC